MAIPRARVSVVVLALFFIAVSPVLADSNITLISLPVNTTSLKIAFRDALNHSFPDRLGALRDSLQGRVKDYVQFVRNVSFDCVSEGGDCTPNGAPCCPGDPSLDEVDLECVPDGDTFTCRNLTSDELAHQRLEAIQYGNSMGMLESHPWINSWEFESRSAMEREELQAAQEAEWKKNWKPSPTQNYWVRAYNRFKKGGKDIWNDLRKMKRLKGFKDSMVDKYNKHIGKTKPPKTDEGITKSPPSENQDYEDGQKDSGKPLVNEKETVDSWIYPDETKGDKKETEESVIKFSDEVKPKREKQIDFRIDDIIRDAANLVEKKLKEKTKAQENKKQTLYNSLESPFSVTEIEDTEDKLMNEIEKLKRLKERQSLKEEGHNKNEPNIEDLIKEQVRAILDEERKLDKLKKIEELKRLEEGMKKS